MDAWCQSGRRSGVVTRSRSSTVRPEAESGLARLRGGRASPRSVVSSVRRSGRRPGDRRADARQRLQKRGCSLAARRQGRITEIAQEHDGGIPKGSTPHSDSAACPSRRSSVNSSSRRNSSRNRRGGRHPRRSAQAPERRIACLIGGESDVMISYALLQPSAGRGRGRIRDRRPRHQHPRRVPEPARIRPQSPNPVAVVPRQSTIRENCASSAPTCPACWPRSETPAKASA